MQMPVLCVHEHTGNIVNLYFAPVSGAVSFFCLVKSKANHTGEAKHLAGRKHPSEIFEGPKSQSIQRNNSSMLEISTYGEPSIWRCQYTSAIKLASQFLRFQSGEIIGFSHHWVL